MKINSVELVNFRNHREAKYEFKEGINLILGENGSGKTSILDAIGMTLFGMKSRSSNSEVLSEGCKTGHVKVCFTGNDGMDYLVVKKFPAGNVTLSEESSKNSITSRQEVFAKISELTGVVSANGDIFENVIVAQQNMLTGVFAGKSGDRERIFNSVFGTEIYRKMYDGLLKSSIEKYQADVNDASSRIDVLSSGLKDAGIILAEVESAAEKVEAAEAARMKCEKDYNESEKLLRVYESAKSEKIRMKQLVESTGKRISDASLRLKNAEAELLSALKFASIAASLKGDHDECETLRKKIDLISGEIAKLEETEKQKNLLLRESSEAQKNAGAAEASAVGLSERIEETIAIGKKIKDEISEFEKRLEEARKECFGANELKSAKEKIFSDFEAKFEVFHGKRNEAAKLEFRHEQMKKGAQDCDLLRKKLEESRGRYLLLEKDLRTRDGHLSDIAKLDALLDELAAAEKKLSGKTCPFLREQCKNLSDGKSTSDYFESRRSDIEKDRHALQLKINGFSGINEKISAELSFRGSCESELEAALKNDKDMADCLAQKEMCSKEAAVAFSQIVRICASGGIDDKYFDEDKCDELRDVLRSSAIKAKGELDACAQKVEMLAANLAAKNAERDAEVKRYSEFKRRHDEALVSVKNEKAKIDKLSTEIASMDVLLKPLDGLKSERQSMNEREKTLSPRSREFIAASAAAASAGEKQRQIDADKALLESLALEKKEAEGKADGIVYDEARHSEQTARGDVLKKYLDEAVSSQTEIKIAYAAALNMQKENAKRLDEISTLKALFDEKNSKFILARNFREQIKDLGPYIAKMRMMSVAKSATENYRKMTGRAERILWESGDEQYQVFLVSAGVRRPYHMLSGGEQVAAALAIRAALAGELTECRFAVFDEPTVNLDAEKREALSVSLNEMLKGLSQALVVTHDSVFREMATNVIELSRGA